MSKNDKGVRNTKYVLAGLFVAGISFGLMVFWQALIGFDLIDGKPFIDIGNTNTYGSFGDFVGGTLNTVFGFLTFLGLLYTIFMQSKELQYTREELRRSASAFEQQNFDNTFFNLMKMLSDAAANSSYEEFKGQDAIIRMHSRFRKVAVAKFYTTKNVRYEEDPTGVLVTSAKFRNDNNKKFQDRYSLSADEDPTFAKYESAIIHSYMSSYSKDLDHYFRVLLNIIKLITGQHASLSDDFDIAKHVGILRSNLSEAELGLIYFKSLTRDGMALKAECERISIFKDLRSTSLIREESITQFKRWAFEGNDNLISLYIKITSEGRQEEVPYIEDNLKS